MKDEVLLPFDTVSNNNNNQNSTKIENNNQITLIYGKILVVSLLHKLFGYSFVSLA